MKSEVLEEMQKSWPKFTSRIWASMNEWDGSRGVLFLSKDPSGYETIDRLASQLTDFIVRYNGENKEEWERKTACVRQKNFQNPLFNTTAGNPCFIIDELNRKPEWMYFNLKGIFEHPAKPCIILASAETQKGIPTYLDGFFSVCKKSGRPRKKTGTKK
jgi:hypothetical protein